MQNKSFTLIELLVVIVIIGILAGVIIVSVSSSINKANFAKAQSFSNTVQNELLGDLVSEWTFDNPSLPGEDTWGNNDGIVSGATYVPKANGECVYGGCMIFDGNDYIDCGELGNPAHGTIALWALKTDTAERYLLDGRGGGNGYLITHYDGYDVNFYGLIHWNGLEINKWNFIVVAVNPTETKLYVNGDFKASGNGLSINFSSVKIGARYTNSSFFLGLIDDVRIYNEALSSSQIREQYIAGINSLLANNNISKEEYNQRIESLSQK